MAGDECQEVATVTLWPRATSAILALKHYLSIVPIVGRHSNPNLVNM